MLLFQSWKIFLHQDSEKSNRCTLSNKYTCRKRKNPLLALEGILEEVWTCLSVSSASISLLNADSDKLVIEVEPGFIKIK